MNYKFLFYTVIASVLMSCCSTSKNISIKKEQSLITNNVQLSNNFRSFWNELRKEAGEQPLDQFIPSDTLIARYSLIKQDKRFYLSGFLYTDSTFNEENIKAIEGNVVVYTEKIKTFSVPVKSIPLLIQIKGITYIEIGKKAKIK